MTAVFSYLLAVSVTFSVTACFLTSRFKSDAERRKILLLRAGASGCVSLILLTALHSVTVLWFCADNHPIPFIASLLTAVGITVAFTVPKNDRFAVIRPRLCRFFRTVGILTAAALLTESLIFHTDSIGGTLSYSPLPTETISSPTVVAENNTVTLKNGESVTYEHLTATSTQAIAVHFEPMKYPVTLSVSVKDDNFREQFIEVIRRRVRTDTGELYLPLNTYGNIYGIQLKADGIVGDTPLVITQTAVTNAVPFSFSVLRFVLMLGAGVAVAAVTLGRLSRVNYDRRRRSHKWAVALTCAVCVSLSASMFVPYFFREDDITGMVYQEEDTVRDLAYPLNYVVAHEAYTQQLDAFIKGQYHLDIEADPTLFTLDNPYDDSQRDNSDTPVYYQWDRAFYNGNYYSYFGVSPLMLFYSPYYALTGSIPRAAFACGFFATLASLFLCLLLRKLCRCIFKKVNLLLLCLGLIASCAASGIWWQHMMASDYALPKLCGLCCLFATLWLGLTACHATSKFARAVAFLLCGASAALTVGARPTMVFGLLLITPVFVGFLASKALLWKDKLVAVLCFLVPLGVGAFALMSYNAARFGSPFDFGASYQLTVSNVAANTLTLSLFPAALAHYFFQPPALDADFPYLRPSFTSLRHYGRYFYNEGGVGVLWFPMILTATAGLPAICRRAFKRSPVKCAMFSAAPVLSVAAAFVTLCMAGNHIGYATDVLAPLIVVALPVVLELYGRLQKRLDSHHFPLFAAILLLTIVFGGCMAASFLPNSPIAKQFFPQLLCQLESALIWWR